MSKISSKKPAELVGTYQIRMINKTLGDVKALLGSDPALAHLELLSDDEIPQYSDVVLLLGQFQTALARFRARFYGKEEDSYLVDARWFTKENPPSVYFEDEDEDEFDEDDE